jgi:nitroimidazol reductase NimA-like FMN-containing flavoprotein (pyridoxamine 5'-phosphate oxidase superfamily)
MTTDDLYSFLTAQRYGVFGTISPENLPQAALVGIAATPSLELIFDTLKTTRKYRNLTANPKVSFVVGWENEITLQYEGGNVSDRTRKRQQVLLGTPRAHLFTR